MIKDGQSFIGPRSQENARLLLRAARQAGVDATQVKAVTDGYLVPHAVAGIMFPDEMEPSEQSEPDVAVVRAEHPEVQEEAPDLSGLKFNELRALARERGLSPAGTKDDLIARLTAEESE